MKSSDYPSRRPRKSRSDGFFFALRRRDIALIGLHHTKLGLSHFLLQIGQIAMDNRHQIGINSCGCSPFIFSVFRENFGGERDQEFLFSELSANNFFVSRIGIRMNKRDGYSFCFSFLYLLNDFS